MMQFKNADTLLSLKEAYNIISTLDTSYPELYDWYWNKVVPGVMLNQDQVLLAIQRNEVVGVSIIKDSDEKKLRALRIKDEFKSKGYGLHLIDESLKRLNTDKPLCSVSGEMINDYSRIFVNRY